MSKHDESYHRATKIEESFRHSPFWQLHENTNQEDTRSRPQALESSKFYDYYCPRA
jgi:hypothetical protein